MRPHAVVTGGAGFLGSHLAERLLAQDVDVTVLDNFSTGSPRNVAHLQGHNGFRLINLDVSNYISIPGPVDYVLHFASPASPVDYAELPIQTLKVGSLGTLNTLGLAMEKGARYLLASTSETYGDPLVHPQPESYWGNVNPVGPRGCYDEAKRFAEALTTAYRTKHGVNTAIMRIFNTYGPRMRPNDGRAIPNFITQSLAGAPITVQGDGSQTRSVCYVDDLIDGALRLLFSDLAGPVNIGNPYEMSVLELAELIRGLTGSSSPLNFIDRAQDDPSQRQPDITLARTELKWEPRVDVRDGLMRTIAWFRDRAEDAVRGTSPSPIDAPLEHPHPSHKVAVIGTGYVGAVTAACMAFLGHSVCGLDTDSVRADQLSNGEAPFFEPGLPEILRSTLSSGRLRFTDDTADALSDADFIFLCVGTPRARTGHRTSLNWKARSCHWPRTCGPARSSSTSPRFRSDRATGHAPSWKTPCWETGSRLFRSCPTRSSSVRARPSMTSCTRIGSCSADQTPTSTRSPSCTNVCSTSASTAVGEVFARR